MEASGFFRVFYNLLRACHSSICIYFHGEMLYPTCAFLCPFELIGLFFPVQASAYNSNLCKAAVKETAWQD